MLSLRASMNNLFYGPLIGRRDLTRQQWSEIHRRANQANLKASLGMIAAALLPIILWQIVVFFAFRTPSITPTMTASQISAAMTAILRRQPWLIAITGVVIVCSPLLSLYVHRRIVTPYLRAAANEMGLVTVCIHCGHNLTGLSTTSTKCPECGQEIART